MIAKRMSGEEMRAAAAMFREPTKLSDTLSVIDHKNVVIADLLDSVADLNEQVATLKRQLGQLGVSR